MSEQDKKWLNNAINTYDNVLNDLINGKIHCKKRYERDEVLYHLTHFVDGYVIKTEKEIWTEEPNDLTNLNVEFFSFNQLVEAVLFAYAVGVENSVILLQEYPAIKMRINFDDLENSKTTKEPDHESNGWLVVFKDVGKSDEALELAFNNANPMFVIAMQDKKWHDISNFPTREDINYEMKFNDLYSKTQVKYQKKEKKKAAYQALKDFLSLRPHRQNVLFNTERHHLDVWNEQYKLFVKE